MSALESPYVILILFTALVVLAVAFVSSRHRSTPGAVPLGALSVAVFVWTTNSALVHLVPGVAAKLLVYKVQYVGIVAVPVGWLVFVLVYVGRGDVLTRRRLAGLGALPVATVALAWTNEFHGMIWRSVQFDTTGVLTEQTIVHGSWFWVHTAYSYLLLAVGTAVLVYKLSTFEWLYRDQAIALLVGAAVPWVGNAAYLAGVTPAGVDPTPIAFAASGIAIATVVFRRQLLEIVPVTREIARDSLVEEMPDGVVVLNAEDRIADVNPTARSILDADGEDVIGRPLEAVRPELAARVADSSDERTEIALEVGGETRHFDLRISPLRRRSKLLAGRLLNFRDVTARKRAETRHQALVEHSTDIVTVLDAEGVIRYESPSVGSVLGYGQDDLVGEDAFAYIHPDDRERVRESFALALEDPAASPAVMYRFRHSDGSWRTLESVGTNRLDDSAVGGIVINSRDVTERVHRERRLESLHEASQKIMASTTATSVAKTAVAVAENVLAPRTASVYLRDDEGDALMPVASTNGASNAIERPPPGADARADPAWRVLESKEVLTPDDAGPLVRSSAGENATDHGTTIAPIGDHGVLTVQSFGGPELGEDDAYFARLLAATAAVALDRVEREQTAAALHDATRDLVESTSRDEIATVAVEAAEEVLGFPFCGVHLLSSDGRRLEPTAGRWAGDGSEWSTALEIDGRSAPARALDRSGPVMDNDTGGKDEAVFGGRASSELSLPLAEYGTLVVGAAESRAFQRYDISLARVLAANTAIGLRQLEREGRLRERTAELERQNERLDEFASVVSHDLRNPLNVATLNLELFAETGDDEYLRGTERAHDHMEEILQKVLDLARQGQIVDDPDPVPFAATVREAWITVETAEAELVQDVESTVLADATRLRELLENLFRNAVEHGGPGITVRVGALEDGFFVADDGPGVPPDDREAVFESGYSTDEDGTGFGLAIVSQIAEAHGWSVTLAEGPDGGARFEFTGVEWADRPPG